MKVQLRNLLAGVAIFFVLAGGCTEREPAAPTPQMDCAEQYWIRVLLAQRIHEGTFTAPSPFSIIESQTGDKKDHFEKPASPIKIRFVGGRLFIGAKSYKAGRIIIFPEKPYIFQFDGTAFRGKLELAADSTNGCFDAVNLVPLEPYLAGVVGAEMPKYWEPAALQAQAIAARTYCLYIKKRFGANRRWDVRRTEANQVYRGLAAESMQVWQAVNKTWGQVLVCKFPDGKEDLFPSYYSSTCGGHTDSAKNVFGQDFPPLAARPCPYCKKVAKPAFFFWPMVKLDKALVRDRLFARYPQLRELGDIVKIVAVRQSDYGDFQRLTSVKLIGSTGKTSFLRAEDFRLCLDPTGSKLRSTIFKLEDAGRQWVFVEGRGYGHGVGMCQCGAEGMARQGWTAEEILQYYYPGSRLKQIY